MTGVAIREVRDAVSFSVRVQPRAPRGLIHGVHGNALKIRLAAPPVDGEANAPQIELLADELDVPRGGGRIVSGATCRTKVVEVAGIAAM